MADVESTQTFRKRIIYLFLLNFYQLLDSNQGRLDGKRERYHWATSYPWTNANLKMCWEDFHFVHEGLGLVSEVAELNVERLVAAVVDEVDVNRTEAVRSQVRRDGERRQDDEDDDSDAQMNDADDFGADFEARVEAESLELDLVRLRLAAPLTNHFRESSSRNFDGGYSVSEFSSCELGSKPI